MERVLKVFRLHVSEFLPSISSVIEQHLATAENMRTAIIVKDYTVVEVEDYNVYRVISASRMGHILGVVFVESFVSAIDVDGDGVSEDTLKVFATNILPHHVNTFLACVTYGRPAYEAVFLGVAYPWEFKVYTVHLRNMRYLVDACRKSVGKKVTYLEKLLDDLASRKILGKGVVKLVV